MSEASGVETLRLPLPQFQNNRSSAMTIVPNTRTKDNVPSCIHCPEPAWDRTLGHPKLSPNCRDCFSKVTRLEDRLEYHRNHQTRRSLAKRLRTAKLPWGDARAMDGLKRALLFLDAPISYRQDRRIEHYWRTTHKPTMDKAEKLLRIEAEQQVVKEPVSILPTDSEEGSGFEPRGSYVYGWYDADGLFYIGKGKAERWTACHLNDGSLAKCEAHRQQCSGFQIRILAHDLTPEEASLIESTMISTIRPKCNVQVPSGPITPKR